jgi:hypothetical protein
MLLLWACPPFRFLSVVWPLMLFFWFRGFEYLATRVSVTVRYAACAVLLGGLVYGITVQSIGALRLGTLTATGMKIIPRRWTDFVAATRKADKLTRPEEILLDLDESSYLYTRRKVVSVGLNPMDLYGREERTSETNARLAEIIIRKRISRIFEMRWAKLDDFKRRYAVAIERDVELAPGYRLVTVNLALLRDPHR